MTQYAPKSRPEIDGLTISNIWRELNEIRAALDTMQVNYLEYSIHNNEPDKPRDGRSYFADGVNWNPGYGKGLYLYIDGLWYPLATAIGHIRPASSLLTLTSYAPLVTRDKVEPVPSGILTLSSTAPIVHVGLKYLIPRSNLTLSGIAPSITVTP